MPDYETLTELLLNQSDAKLRKLRDGIVRKQQSLQFELHLVDEAIKERTRAKASREGTGNGGQPSEGLSRQKLFLYVQEMNRPAKAAEVRAFLATKNIERRVEAVRNGLVRLEDDGLLERDSDGRFVVRKSDGAEVKSPVT
jgi:hypothetical protein